MQGHGLFAKDDTVEMASMDADVNVCYAQWTSNAEEECLEVLNVEVNLQKET